MALAHLLPALGGGGCGSLLNDSGFPPAPAISTGRFSFGRLNGADPDAFRGNGRAVGDPAEPKNT